MDPEELERLRQQQALLGQEQAQPEQGVNATDVMLGGAGLGGAAFFQQTGRPPAVSPTPKLSKFAQQVAANDARNRAASQAAKQAARQAGFRGAATAATQFGSKAIAPLGALTTGYTLGSIADQATGGFLSDSTAKGIMAFMPNLSFNTDQPAMSAQEMNDISANAVTQEAPVQPEQSRIGTMLSNIGESLKSGFSQPPAGTTSVPVDVTGQRFAGETIGEYLTNPEKPSMMEAASMVTPATSAAQAMKEQLGIPAPSDMSPNVPVGTGTVMQGSGPIAGQSVMQGIRDMDTQAAQAAQPAQMTQQILDPQGRLRRGSVDPQTGQVTLAPEYSGYEEAAAARQARAMQESTFMESVPDSQRRGDGLSDSEMRRYMKGKDPKASDREKAYSARIDMQRKNEATQTAAQQAMDLAQMRIDASVESQEAAQENAMKLARIRKQLTPSEAREAELKIEALEQSVAAGNQVDPSDIQKVLTSVGIPTLGDIKYDAQRNVFVDTAGLNETFGPESAVFRILAGTKVGRTIMGGGPNMKVISTRPSQG